MRAFCASFFFLFFFNDTATTEIYTLSLHDALPISLLEAEGYEVVGEADDGASAIAAAASLHPQRSEEHTSELQSHSDLVCRLLLEKKKKKTCLEGDYAYVTDRAHQEDIAYRAQRPI